LTEENRSRKRELLFCRLIEEESQKAEKEGRAFREEREEKRRERERNKEPSGMGSFAGRKPVRAPEGRSAAPIRKPPSDPPANIPTGHFFRPLTQTSFFIFYCQHSFLVFNSTASRHFRKPGLFESFILFTLGFRHYFLVGFISSTDSESFT
jgi:hypothetical protein